ncbi:hypothetical protein [Streptomyces lushanensis]|uniref:hypothetical protein n=1 Tax=Streptomyces lushanensis TaxID=1434255 RepID=UPI00082BCC11|nr:hypothetical protein [Streptomyces lushanensis]
MSGTVEHDPGEVDLDLPVTVHPLVYLDEGETTTLGRPDIDAYVILPTDGAELVRRLAAGDTPREAARWYETTYGEEADVAGLITDLSEVGLLRLSAGGTAATDRTGTATTATGPAAAGSATDARADEGPVRWQRFGKAVFSPPAAAVYALVVAAAITASVLRTDLAPHYRHIFFSDYYTIVELGLFVGQVPLMLLHEAAHALAGRRLGLRTRLSIGRRLYFVVLETSMDGLVVVERGKRYLPMLAGLGADAVVWSALTLIAAGTREPDGSFSALGRVALALAFSTILRMVWQMYFYLRTDVYYLVTTVLGCTDLHGTSVQVTKNRYNRLRGRTERLVDESVFSPADRKAAQWYSWVMLVGYAVMLTSLVLAGLPTAYRFLTGVLGRLTGDAATAELADSATLVALNVLQFGIVGVLAFRARRARKSTLRPLSE